jgi:hypothetical protein
MGDNLWFEERVSTVRQAVFEDAVRGAQSPDDLKRRHTDYWNEFVKVDEGVAHTFLQSLEPADLGDLHETQKIVRVERLDRPLGKAALSFDRLKRAVERNETEIIDGFLRTWHNSNIRDWRPAFAAFKDELSDTLLDHNWPESIRNRLGLAHFDCTSGPIPIALMEYSIDEVRKAANAQAGCCAVAAPTALDSMPWPFFFPAPRDLTCGRTMSLIAVDHERELLAEILHFRITYRREHISRLGEIRNPPEAFDIADLRNRHLLAVQLASDRDVFGAEIE